MGRVICQLFTLILASLVVAACSAGGGGTITQDTVTTQAAGAKTPESEELTEQTIESVPPTPTPTPTPPAFVTPGSQPPAIGVLTSLGVVMAGPSTRKESLGIIDEGEQVEILSTTDEWTQVRRVSWEGTEVTGWVESLWIETPTPIRPTPDFENLPSFDEAVARNDIKVAAGDSAEDIISAYGEPSKDEILSNFNPPVMRSIRYLDLGLRFTLNKDRLCCIDFSNRFTGEVFGLKVGDYIDTAIAIFGDDYEQFETATYNVGMCDGYRWSDKLPNWYIRAKDGFIVGFGYLNKEIYGKWAPELP